MSINVSKIDAYSISVDGEWATICMRQWQRQDSIRPDGTSPRPYYGGEILIHSSFGSWANTWTACATPFRQFLLDVEFGYFMGKLMGTNLECFDASASSQSMRETLLQARRRGEVSKDWARKAWDVLIVELQDAEVEDTLDAFVRACDVVHGEMIEQGAPRTVVRMFTEPWERARTSPDVQAVGFWRDIWPAFTRQIQAEARDAALLAPV